MASPRSHRRCMLRWCLLLFVGGLMAPGVARSEPVTEPRPLLYPGQLDLRLEGAASLLPLSVEAGAAVEVGVLPLGAGTLTLGAELGVTECALECWVPNLVFERDVSRRDLHALGRLGYHFTVADRNYRKVDVYGVLLGGVMEARTTVDAPDYHYDGRGRGPVLGLGLGGNYFPSSRFFFGGEARLRFASGPYGLTLTRGTYDFTRADSRWIRAGLSTAFFVGIRLF